MKGFIEVTNGTTGTKQLINVDGIRGVSGRDPAWPEEHCENANGAVAFADGVIPVRESYETLKGMISEAVY